MAIMLVDASTCRAQEIPAPSVERQAKDPLEEFRAADRAVKDAFEAYRKEVEEGQKQSEGKADAGDLSIQASELPHLAGLLENEDFEALDFFSEDDGVFSLDKFPKVKKAKAEFRAAIKQRVRIRKQRFPLVVKELIASAVKACREQQSLQQIAATLAQVPEYEKVGEELDSEALLHSPRQTDFKKQLDYLSAFRSFVVALANGDLVSLKSLFHEFELMKVARYDALMVKELEEYRTSTTNRIRQHGGTEAVRILKAGLAAESAESVAPMIAELEKYAALEEALAKPPEGRWDDPVRWDRLYERVRSFLREWQNVLSMEAEGRLKEAAQTMLRVKGFLTSMDPQIVALAEKRSQLLSAKAQKAQQTMVTNITDKLPQRIAEIATPEALQDFSDELTPLIAEASGKPDSFAEWLRSFQTELQRIVAAWRIVKTDPAFAIRAVKETRTSHPWAKEAALLRDKVMRQAAVIQTGRTELLDPPLNQIPLAEAFQKLVATAAGNSDWERAYSLLLAQVAIFPDSPGFQDIDAIKEYLAGTNLEKAELFADAAQAYRTVLRSIGKNVPTKQAAERLKAIQSKHPELFK